MTINIQPGHIARHTPRGAGSQGRDAAIIDIAQDLLLRYLHETGILSHLVFKGGTALRKMYAGSAGRFSLDLDFSIAEIGESEDEIISEMINVLRICLLVLSAMVFLKEEENGSWNSRILLPLTQAH